MSSPPEDHPVLYSFRRCPYAMRARLAILSSGAVCELREVMLRNKPDAMVKVSPKATVPVLLLSDGRVLEESLDIMYWALDRDDPDGLLAPSKSNQPAIRALLEEIDGPFKFHLDRYKYASRYEGADPYYHREVGVEHLRALGERLSDQSWLFGRKPTLPDFAILPFVRQFRIADPKWFDSEAGLESIQQWLGRFLELEIFSMAMEKFTPWTPGDEPLWFGGAI